MTQITDVYQVITVTEPYGEGDDRVEPGIYVVGGEYADNGCTEVWMHVDFALDTDGNDATRYVAERIATVLSATRDEPRIHNHHTLEGEKQRQHIAEVIRDCREQGLSDEATASSVFVALLNPRMGA